MKHLAIGWACSLKDIFIRFPYEKCKSLVGRKHEKETKVCQVFRVAAREIFKDIVENNVTFKIQGIGYQGGEIHMEAVTGSKFERQYRNGKFQGVDFLESLFTGYLMYLYIHGKFDNFLHKKKYPIYHGSYIKDILTQYTNEGKVYC